MSFVPKINKNRNVKGSKNRKRTRIITIEIIFVTKLFLKPRLHKIMILEISKKHWKLFFEKKARKRK